MPLIPDELMEILVCPACKGDLEAHEEDALLECVSCGLRYPVKDGIPIMLIEEATRRPAE